MSTLTALTANLELNAAQFRKELDASNARIKSLEGRTKSMRASNDGMERSFRGAAQGIAAMDGPLGGISSRISAVNSLVGSGAKLWAGLGAGVAAAAFATVKGIQAFTQMETAQLKTDALLRATGTSAGRTAEQLDAQARSVAGSTLANTAGIREAQQVMLTFRSVQEETFDRAIGLSQDLTAVMGGSASSAALQLGKALESPSTGLSALTRNGISFTEAEKDVIKGLEETGRVAEAQTLILDKLAGQVGGASSSEAGGVAGAADTLAQAWEEMLESLGKTGPATLAGSTMNGLASAIRSVNEAIDPSEGTRLGELDLQIAGLNKGLRDLTKYSPTGMVADKKDIRANIAILEAERQKIIQLRVDRERGAQAASIAAAEARTQLEQDRRHSARLQAEEKGAAAIGGIDSSLADAAEKVRLDGQKKIAAIEQLQLAEQEIQSRGFETIDQLRADYIARAEAQTIEMLASIEQDAEEKRIKEQERIEKEISDKKTKDDNLVNLHKERLNRLHDDALRAEERTLELEQVRHERQLVEIDEQMTLLQERNLLTAEIEEDFRSAREYAETAHQQRLTEIEKKENEERIKNQRVLWDALSGIAVASRSRTASLLIAIGKELFDAEKREAMKKALIDGKVAIQKAIAGAPFPANVPAIAFATAQSAANVAQIQGIAHGGLDNVKREGTYLLDEGEGVLQPRANTKLMDFLDREKSGKTGGSNVQLIVHNNAPVDVRQGAVTTDQNGNLMQELVIEAVRTGLRDARFDSELTEFGVSRSGGVR